MPRAVEQQKSLFVNQQREILGPDAQGVKQWGSMIAFAMFPDVLISI